MLGKRVDCGETPDTKIPVVDDDKKIEKIGSNVIECSVSMNVSLSRAKRSKIFQRAQYILVVLLTIAFAVLCFRLRREVHALEMQIKDVNSNIMAIMLRYEKMNRNINRNYYEKSWSRRHGSTSDLGRDLTEDPLTRRRHSWRDEKIEEEAPSTKRPENGNEKISTGHSWRSGNENSFERIGKKLLEKKDGERDGVDNAGIDQRDEDSSERDRYERAIVTFERRNREPGAPISTPMSRRKDDSIDDTWIESRNGRYRRDEGRGKKRRKMKRRLKRSRQRLGPFVATFVGAVPEQHITDAVYVGPWVRSMRNESRYAFSKFHLVENKTSIELTANGLYMISAQIYYFGEPNHFSYWILVSSEGSSSRRKVIKCATVSALSASDASCYTSVILTLRPGDRIHIQQQERDRVINLREGYSYVQLMLLSGDTSRRRNS